MLQRFMTLVIAAIMMTMVSFVSAPAEAHAADSDEISQQGCVTYYDQNGNVTSISCGEPYIGGVASDVYSRIRDSQEWAGVKGHEIQGQLFGEQAAEASC
ncbi:hypothetical protein IPM65_06030 [Candidatus Roizmanbacteria bacterium]|nr:MAG: hypothetical protein IPM65_06030 [Candidatus Roizmanbacteria bacterium]